MEISTYYQQKLVFISFWAVIQTVWMKDRENADMKKNVIFLQGRIRFYESLLWQEKN